MFDEWVEALNMLVDRRVMGRRKYAWVPVLVTYVFRMFVCKRFAFLFDLLIIKKDFGIGQFVTCSVL